MDEAAVESQKPVVSTVRKKIRSGTHSCTECRRRKIRCTFTPNVTVCSPCSARGSRCVDQRQEPYPAPSFNLNARGGQDSTSNQAIGHAITQDIHADVLTDEQSSRVPRVPLVSVIAASEVWDPTKYFKHNSIAQLRERKAKSVCESLRSALPSFDTVISTLSKHGAWWGSFRFKTHPIDGQPAEGLIEFATRTYTSNNPALLGILATAYARSLNRSQQIYALVESVVISDSAYSCTIEGLECLILLARSLMEIGYPRRAWLLWRRGMASAQLMGLYREGVSHPLATSVWWAIFHGDRFTSLLLGVPHGFNDSYYGSDPGCNEPPVARFILRTAILAGKVTEKHLITSKPSLGQTLFGGESLMSPVVP
ncbi:hypothetical protein PG987_001840 [Apiospora arundinis]